MAKLTYVKELQIDSVDKKVSSTGKEYCYIHLVDIASGDSDKYSCSSAVYDQVKDKLPVTAHVYVKFESWYDDNIKRGGKREYVYNLMF